MATAFGLAIAIVSVLVYYFLLNRVDVLVRELDDAPGRSSSWSPSESQRHVPQDRRHTPRCDRRAAPTGLAGDRSMTLLDCS